MGDEKMEHGGLHAWMGAGMTGKIAARVPPIGGRPPCVIYLKLHCGRVDFGLRNHNGSSSCTGCCKVARCLSIGRCRGCRRWGRILYPGNNPQPAARAGECSRCRLAVGNDTCMGAGHPAWRSSWSSWKNDNGAHDEMTSPRSGPRHSCYMSAQKELLHPSSAPDALLH